MTTPIRQNMPQEVAEGGSALLTWTAVDELGAPVTLAQLTTLTWTHYDESSGAVVNGRNLVNIKNANGGTVHATTGACTLTVTPADNVLVSQASRGEWKVAYIRWTYNGGAGTGEKEIAYLVRALRFNP